jgi:NAD+ synthase
MKSDILFLSKSDQEIKEISIFIKETLDNSHKKKVVIAVSGGIDSALSLGLLSKTILLENIYPIFLPYDQQDMTDARNLVKHLDIPKENWQEVNIKEIVDSVVKTQNIGEEDKLRRGNVMSRSRMIIVYDFAKKFNALVCGTENKSEKYLGYFTRFGDEASDFEPIMHLYKTQVRQLVKELGLPKVLLSKAPSAGLWENQTDEQELGFLYQDADLIIDQIIEKKKDKKKFIKATKISLDTIEKVIKRVASVNFKHQVPYFLQKK